MPYSRHPACNIPDDLNQKLWRYLDFTKFVSMLEEKALFFPKLSSLSDPLEGFLTKPTVEKFRNIPEGLTAEEAAKRRTIGEHNLSMMKTARDLLYVSSWHANNHESIAMWGLYLKSGEGVAICSSIERMIESFANTKDEIHIGRVDYVDYEKEEIPWHNAFYLALHKAKSFEHENEIRVIVMSPDNLPGKLVPVDLAMLIDKVFVAPNSPAWIHDLIKKVITKYRLNEDIIHHSGSEQKPMY